MKKSQKQFVIDRLLNDRCISRNACIQNYITRLSAIIQKLEQDGWIFDGQYEHEECGKDFVYYLRYTPYKRVEYFVPELNKTIVKFDK